MLGLGNEFSHKESKGNILASEILLFPSRRVRGNAFNSGSLQFDLFILKQYGIFWPPEGTGWTAGLSQQKAASLGSPFLHVAYRFLGFILWNLYLFQSTHSVTLGPTKNCSGSPSPPCTNHPGYLGITWDCFLLINYSILPIFSLSISQICPSLPSLSFWGRDSLLLNYYNRLLNWSLKSIFYPQTIHKE